MNLCFQRRNILMVEHNEYLLLVYGGVFKVVSECGGRHCYREKSCHWSNIIEQGHVKTFFMSFANNKVIPAV